MVFGGDFDDVCERYTSEAEAAVGHQRVVTETRTAIQEASRARN